MEQKSEIEVKESYQGPELIKHESLQGMTGGIEGSNGVVGIPE